ncbi:GNAT family N-acetyltransferase [Kribbella sandramycini]|uniref:GNAT family N-acetyltransferase n=1 Tax=Kribbella sandramycini TaxID=60450 RepID=A0A7Y4KVB4_9ACTN|nr:GNAT family N-acetyltransferase [Kribbella sandramycini]MBB6568084.1 ribosomal protein S18 acetylase RimI-like enzyme [Kribbella sandramycini]NOL39322.1 GNAT family N-acetyltransferase [Kribbella sandramycini]
MLRNPSYAALTGPHASFAEVRGNAVAYPSDVAPFCGVPAEPTAQDWADLAALLGPGRRGATMRPAPALPESLKLVDQFDLVQFVAPEGLAAPDAEAVALTVDDVPDMIALVALTDPGPFRPRTIELGPYLGIREGGELIAMAGVRKTLSAYAEISAVCTHPDHRGRGLARRLIGAVAAEITATGRRPFLHTGGTNTTAQRLYSALGFTVTNRMHVTIVEPAG